MTGLRFFLIVLCGFFTLAAHAEPLPETGDIEKVLAAPDAVVEGYDLAQDDLKAFYAARGNRPAWNFAGPENAAALMAFLDSIDRILDYHGLQHDDYPLDLMRKLASTGGEGGGLKLELLVTDTLSHLAHDLHGDTLDLDQLYPGWDFHRGEADIPAGLAEAVAGSHLEDYIKGLTPKNPAYPQLAQALKAYRDIAVHGGWKPVDAGPILRPGDENPRVVQLRTRLAAEDYVSADIRPMFDEDLRRALIAYQTRNGLGPDGQAGKKTIESLNVPVSVRTNQIRANMERWRHMPEDFPPERYALVNIADASLDIIEGGKPVYRGPVVVGRVDRKTPFIQSEIRSMIVNPSWHVPKNIAQKDILPKLRQDPHYLEKLGFVIKGNKDDPYGENIDWASMPEREFNLRLRQEPGDMNSLGRLKFDFDNDFAVYMHGTPHQELFKKFERTFSSGCVRLRDPEEVAKILLAGNREPWSIDRINEEIDADKTRWVAIADPMPIYILYWTVFADSDGKLNFRSDVYDYDRFLIENMAAESMVDKNF